MYLLWMISFSKCKMAHGPALSSRRAPHSLDRTGSARVRVREGEGLLRNSPRSMEDPKMQHLRCTFQNLMNGTYAKSKLSCPSCDISDNPHLPGVI